jgi:L-alanine-DL-glutamate epimerase-like enolase superfamily enzyme
MLAFLEKGPDPFLHTHVHSMRAASGAEVLVARVLANDGTAGFGFTFNLEAGVARDMASWDALARKCKVPLYTLLGGSRCESVPVLAQAPAAVPADFERLKAELLAGRSELLAVDPFAWGSLERMRAVAAAAAAFDAGIVLVAPNAHPWEIAWCTALAALLPGDDVRVAPASGTLAVSDAPGIGVDWSLEPGFAGLRW